MKLHRVFLFLAAALLAGAAGAWVTVRCLDPKMASPYDTAPATAPSEEASGEFEFGQRVDLSLAAEKTLPAVVSVKAMGSAALGNTSGSGVIIDADGFIATNRHVIEGSKRVFITLHDRREFWADLIGVDEATDLALLKIDGKGELPFATFGNSDSLRTGQWLLAMGNPFGLRSTVTAGILSARGRSIDVLAGAERIESFLQTDAAVNPGSSGGGLVNSKGELIGINTAILSESGRHEGFNFAIPGNLAKRVLEDLRQYGEVRRATLGVYLQTVNAAQAKKSGLELARGVIVTKPTRNGAALRAGIETGDVILAINGIEVNSAQEMQEVLSRYRPGERVRVSYIRRKRAREITVTLRGNTSIQPRQVNDRDFLAPSRGSRITVQ